MEQGGGSNTQQNPILAPDGSPGSTNKEVVPQDKQELVEEGTTPNLIATEKICGNEEEERSSKVVLWGYRSPTLGRRNRRYSLNDVALRQQQRRREPSSPTAGFTPATLASTTDDEPTAIARRPT